MVDRRNVSIPDKQAEFVDERGLSLSKILQNEIASRMKESTVKH